jgi:hypothetical protein
MLLTANVLAVALLFIFIASPGHCLAQTTCGTAQQQPQGPARDPNDPSRENQGRGMNRSQVMQTLGYLSDVIGPRLTASQT